MNTEQLNMDNAFARNTDPDTSHAAAVAMHGSEASRACKTILEAVKVAGEVGLTNHEIAHITGINLQSVTPRIKPMREDGLLIDSGLKRKGDGNRMLKVWRAA